jgi:hypothetical protein
MLRLMETPEEEAKGRPDPKPEDERSYEDNWYQVLRRRQAEGSDDEDDAERPEEKSD